MHTKETEPSTEPLRWELEQEELESLHASKNADWIQTHIGGTMNTSFDRNSPALLGTDLSLLVFLRPVGGERHRTDRDKENNIER